MNLEILMGKWLEENDPITDINEELKDVKEQIDKYKSRNMSRKLKEEEEKLALLLQIFEAQKGPGGQKPAASDILSDQE